MDRLSEHDARQLERMEQRLAMFEEGKTALRVLIADLEFLLSALESVPSSIRAELQEQWGVLEQVYSVAVAMHDGRMDPHGEQLVGGAVKMLRGRVREIVGGEPGAA